MDKLRVETRTGARAGRQCHVELERGEVLGLIGESGAGKSTIGLAALGYARSGCRICRRHDRDGRPDVRGLDAAGRRDIRGRRVAYVAQSAAASFNPAIEPDRPDLRGRRSRHGLMDHAEASRRPWAVHDAGLPNPETFGERYPHQVSGGQLQRAMAAMAMACRPDILVLRRADHRAGRDDADRGAGALKKLIREFNTAALYITHDLAVVAQVADRIMVLRHGKMVEVGTTDRSWQAPQNDYTRALVTEREPATRAHRDGGQARRDPDEVDNVDARATATTRR